MRHCRICETEGHDRRNCPQLGDVEVDLDIAEVAELRELRDALTKELAEYEQLKLVVDQRIVENKASIIDATRSIEKIRTEIKLRRLESSITRTVELSA